ncbi:S8 family serine peptidase [Candidatus Lokiarchaeum ossiferum]|uniref:S8 family serine peptidase n=1 Tax=Candidatus Lokiarchaeum ossiferum TaxID=2951803 RepID=UPI00352EEF2B
MIISKFHENFDPIELWVAKHSPIELLETQFDLERLSNEIIINYLVQFRDFDQLEQFVNNNKKSQSDSNVKLKILSEFHHFPVVLLESTYQECYQLSDNHEIIRIYGNYPIYLCGEEFNKEINLEEIHNSYEEITGKGIRIAILDSGIDPNKLGYSKKQFKQIGDSIGDSNHYNPHGTNLASIIVGSGQNSQNFFSGIAPNIELIDIKVFDSDGSSTLSDIIRGLENLLDLPQDEMPHILLFGCSAGFKGVSDDLFSHYLPLLSSKNIILIAPTGNLGPDPGNIGNPSMNPNVICIGAVDQQYKKLFFSGRNSSASFNKSSGLKPTFVLPGKNVPATISRISGTSSAAAIFAGFAALFLQVVPNCTSTDLVSLFQQNSMILHLPEYTQGFGLPQIDSILQKTDKFTPKPLSYNYLLKMALKMSGIITFMAVAFVYLSRFII